MIQMKKFLQKMITIYSKVSKVWNSGVKVADVIYFANSLNTNYDADISVSEVVTKFAEYVAKKYVK